MTTKELERKLADLTQRHNDAVDEANSLAGTAVLTRGQQTRYDDLQRAIDKLKGEIRQAEADLSEVQFTERADAGRADLERRLRDGSAVVERGDDPTSSRTSTYTPTPEREVWNVDLGRMGTEQIRDAARRAIETTQRSHPELPESAFEAADSLVTDSNQTEAARAAQWALVASDPQYRTAFAKLVRDPDRGHLEWTREEQTAYARTSTLARAMSLTNTSTGAALVPFTLDPAIMLTNDGSNNPLRQLATIKRTTTNTWNGVTSAGATSEWKDEAAEAVDGSPTLAQPSIPVFLGDSFVPYSYEFGMDALDAMDELGAVLADSADNLMAAAYTTGNGTSAPQGIVTGLVGTASEINGQGSEAIAATDPFDLQNALPARFSANATWQAHIATMNTYRQFETSNGAHEFPELRQNPPYLLGKRFYENSNMDGAINAAATANNYVMVYGDVARGFFIVDRIGTTVELIPNIMGDNNRPTGQRGMFLWFRTGSEVVVPQALRLLDIPTTA